jgi:hypothetical protein
MPAAAKVFSPQMNTDEHGWDRAAALAVGYSWAGSINACGAKQACVAALLPTPSLLCGS